MKVIDWAWPHRGPAWIDTAFLVPQLILAGQAPSEAEKWAALDPDHRGRRLMEELDRDARAREERRRVTSLATRVRGD